MEVSLQLECPCKPGFLFKSQTTLRVHQKSKAHTLWAALEDNKNDRVRSKDFENKLERLTRRLEHKERIEEELLARIKTLEEDVEYWKSACECT
jgi:septal ring factor EnvC (AmiA/AmiB activator)